jgi:uncharacterized protein
MLKIHIGSITDRGLDLDETVDPARLPLLQALSGEGEIGFTRPIHVRLHATLAGETVLIEGTAGTGVRIPCSRCLEPFGLNVRTEFSATATPQPPSMTDTDAVDDIELAADEIDVIAYSGDSIDIADEIAKQIIMAIPFNPLCSDRCKGLCSRCGADLNKNPCNCSPQGKNNPFAALNALSFPKAKD